MRGGAGPEASELRRLLSDLAGESGQLLAALDRSTSSPHSRSTTTVAAQRGSTLGAALPSSRQSGAWLGLG